MSINQIKASNFNDDRKATMRDVASSLSKLNVLANKALKQQAYVRKNPDDNGVDEFKTVLSADIDSISASLSEVNEKLSDLMKVKSDEMTVDELIAKYSIDLAGYSLELL